LFQFPVVNGYSFPHLTKRMNVAAYLVDLLSRRGRGYFLFISVVIPVLWKAEPFYASILTENNFCSSRYAVSRTADFETVRAIKEKLCYIRLITNLKTKIGIVWSIIFSQLLIYFPIAMITRGNISRGLRSLSLLRILL
jgi:hypothetical protein